MKKHSKYHRYIVMLIIVFIMIYIIPPMSSASLCSSSFNKSKNVAILPTRLNRVEDEAFSGTALSAIIFKSGFQNIGACAFQNSVNLKDVYIPFSVRFIGAHAFPSNVNIYGIVGSYAQKWANKNGHRFIEKDIWSCVTKTIVELRQILLYILLVPAVSDEMIRNRRWFICRYIISMRPQDRTELFPIDYRFP